MMKKKVVVACAGAVATSTVVAKKILELCEKKGIDIEICQVRISEIETNLTHAKLLVTTSKIKKDYGVPHIVGMPFISGIGVEKAEQEIIKILCE